MRTHGQREEPNRAGIRILEDRLPESGNFRQDAVHLQQRAGQLLPRLRRRGTTTSTTTAIFIPTGTTRRNANPTWRIHCGTARRTSWATLGGTTRRRTTRATRGGSTRRTTRATLGGTTTGPRALRSAGTPMARRTLSDCAAPPHRARSPLDTGDAATSEHIMAAAATLARRRGPRAHSGRE